jgi:hypothetical protein
MAVYMLALLGFPVFGGIGLLRQVVHARGVRCRGAALNLTPLAVILV